MERINIHDKFVVLHCIAHITAHDHNLEKAITANRPSDHPYEYNFEFKVNGVEIPFSKYLEYLHTSYEDNVTRKAKELIQDKFYDVTSVCDDFMDKLKEITI